MMEREIQANWKKESSPMDQKNPLPFFLSFDWINSSGKTRKTEPGNRFDFIPNKLLNALTRHQTYYARHQRHCHVGYSCSHLNTEVKQLCAKMVDCLGTPGTASMGLGVFCQVCAYYTCFAQSSAAKHPFFVNENQ